ncbi:MAG: AMP-binding protein [Spirochaetales bacterium]|nr:AMP-binding protein [Spirochaetales bacterium]
MRTVIKMLNEAAQKWGRSPYLSQKIDGNWKSLGFDEARDESYHFASSLVKRGFRKEDTIAIISEGRNGWVTTEFGLLMAGCISVPLSIKLLPEEIPFRLNHSEAKAVIVSENVFPKLANVWSEIEGRPLVIVLSDDEVQMRKAAVEAGFSWGVDIIAFEDMVAEGRKGLDEVRGELDKRIEAIDEDDVVTISYTSGTTGNPKGIMLTHKNYYSNSFDAIATVRLPEKANTLIVLPLDHSFAHTVGLYTSLISGFSISFVDSVGGGMKTLRNIPINLAERSPYFLLTVPALTGNFMKKIQAGLRAKGKLLDGIFTRGVAAGIRFHGDGYNRPSLWTRLGAWFPYKLASLLIFPTVRKIFGNNFGFCVGGGALLEIKQQEFFNAIGAPIYQGYGLTEAAPIICSNTPDKHKFGTSGLIMPSIECRIMKDDGTEATPFETGEIVIRGDNVMKGYFKNPEDTAKTLRDGWLWTGDLGYKDPDGFLGVVGREKALLIAADGEKYSPEEIEEAVINNAELINQVMVYNEQRKTTTALVTINAELLKSRAGSSTEDLLAAIEASFFSFQAGAHNIPLQWIPSTFAIIEEPFSENNQLINSTMKLVRHKVRDYYGDRIELMYEDDSAHRQANLEVVGRLLKA